MSVHKTLSCCDEQNPAIIQCQPHDPISAALAHPFIYPAFRMPAQFQATQTRPAIFTILRASSMPRMAAVFARTSLNTCHRRSPIPFRESPSLYPATFPTRFRHHHSSTCAHRALTPSPLFLRQIASLPGVQGSPERPIHTATSCRPLQPPPRRSLRRAGDPEAHSCIHMAYTSTRAFLGVPPAKAAYPGWKGLCIRYGAGLPP
ncbi:hypothetical protein BD413DRAFT_81808 [Trametes elegans]|nr:hypothetical protein BD413DRAFT_81808 [Trametes elegans]